MQKKPSSLVSLAEASVCILVGSATGDDLAFYFQLALAIHNELKPCSVPTQNECSLLHKLELPFLKVICVASDAKTVALPVALPVEKERIDLEPPSGYTPDKKRALWKQLQVLLQ